MEKMYPVHKNTFKINSLLVKGLTSFGVSFENGTEEWYTFEDEGWIDRMVTAKGWSIDLTGNRAVGDEGNDYVANLVFAIGNEAIVPFEWVMVDGTTIASDMVIEVTNTGGGDSTNIAPLEFTLKSKGKPKITLRV